MAAELPFADVVDVKEKIEQLKTEERKEE